MWALLRAVLSFLLCLAIAAFAFPAVFRYLCQLQGNKLRRFSKDRRELLLAQTANEQKAFLKQQKKALKHEGWEAIGSTSPGPGSGGFDGFIGFFHPFCNAGGGGERVLWEAIRATQQRWPKAICVVYTGDQDVDKSKMLQNVRKRFDISLHPPNVHFLYLTKRYLVEGSTWPRFTLAGQSLGSLILGWEAFKTFVPDIFFDTMGYAYVLWLSSLLFPSVPTGAYVHYPTISTDMLDSLSDGGRGIHAGAASGWQSHAKKDYWRLFAWTYSYVGRTIDVVLTNSTWTQFHIQSLWAPSDSKATSNTTVLFPPVSVSSITSSIPILDRKTESQRHPHLLYIAQFRPEKNHELIIRSFAALVKRHPKLSGYASQKPKLILVGSVRPGDEKSIYKLRILARELGLVSENPKDFQHVEFKSDAPWPVLLDYMRTCTIGVNGMWAEHFGIGVVEYQAAGLISVVNGSGGPRLDIVVPMTEEGEGGKGETGFHAGTEEEYTRGFEKALSLGVQERVEMRQRARRSAERFSSERFEKGWVRAVEKLVKVRGERVR
ncbi:glycosyltransferase family 4 protein [Sporormia fimetaria CBS 119925]|uniref:GDP-Man:Man(3)GlcNAc(2)-PP-Dol alpha-1,2-mannosyltransferase n=1 Tax=Sporormia fimetaria CBS 119925 TaxID=1340428 RepID=A0A6A6V8U6_9PLEO|nr:glycosyltransferase family 4 protein [Sporormia fimetaria CBS 119925]